MIRYAVELLSVIMLLLTVAGCSSGHVPPEPAQIEQTPASATSIAPATNTAQQPLSTLELAESTDAGAPESPTPIPTLETLPQSVGTTWESSPSPDGLWIARTVMHDESLELSTARGEQYWNYVSQHVAATDGSITHTVRAEWVPDGVGGMFPQVLGWTLDSSAAFLYVGGGPDGCGVNGFSQDMWRVSTDDGLVLNLGSVPGIPSISRDATRIGGSRLLDDDQGAVTWIEAATATQHSSSFPVPQDLSAEWTELSPPIWSPDGKSIVVRVVYNGCSAEWHETLVFHDLVTGTSNVVAESSEGFGMLYVEDWQPDDTLVISESVSPWANSNSDSVERRIDARTGRTR